MRLVAHFPCDHGEYAAHPLDPSQPVRADGVNLCRGGSSIIIDPDNVPDEMVKAAHTSIGRIDYEGVRLALQAALSAALRSEVEP